MTIIFILHRSYIDLVKFYVCRENKKQVRNRHSMEHLNRELGLLSDCYNGTATLELKVSSSQNELTPVKRAVC